MTSPTDSSAKPILEVRGLSKRYPGVQALDAVDWVVRAGEIHALVGPNGAGKSTLVGIIAGTERPDAGQVTIAGHSVRRFDPLAAARLGVAFVPQRPALFPSVSVLDNLFVGAWPGGPVAIDWKGMAARARQVFARLGLDLDPFAPLSSLSVADQQMVQIARALLHDARLFIFDEPTAALSSAETARLFAILRDLRAAGCGVIYITHRLPELPGLADRITVMRDGRIITTAPAADLPEDRIVELMAGRAVGAPVAPKSAPAGEEILRVEGLRGPGFSDCSFVLHSGEILGVTGLAGSGAAQLCRAVAGAEPAAGRITIAGAPASYSTVSEAQRYGLCLVPGDRQREGLLPGLSVRHNLTVTALRRLASRLGLVNERAERHLAARLVDQLQVRLTSLDQPVETLSGGNQQKTLVGRALAADPRLLVLIEPTQGVDVAARAEIHTILRQLAARGVAILVAGSDVPELLSLCDRIIVMHRGRIAAELDARRTDERTVLRYSSGVAERSERYPEGASEGPFGAQKVPGGPGAPEGPERCPRGTQKVPEGSQTGPKRYRRGLTRELALAAFVVALCVAVGAANPRFLTPTNLTDVASNAAYILVAAAAMTPLIITANIDISVGSMLGLCAALAASLAVRGAPLVAVVAAAMAGGAALGLVNAAATVGLRLPSIIVTLGTLNVFRGLLLLATGGRWITGLPWHFRVLSVGRVAGVPVGVFVAAAVAGAIALALRHTRWGRCVYLWGDNEAAARHLGVRGRRLVVTVMALTGACVGLAAAMFAARFSAVQSNAGLGFEMLVITCVVVGGTDIFGGSGSIFGTILGVALVALIGNALTLLHLSEYWDKAAQGALILAAVSADVLRRGRKAP